jgi:Putative Ig domain
LRKVTLGLVGISTLFLALVTSGCGGGASFGISINLAVSPAPTLDQGQVVTVTATIVNDSTNKGVTWSLSGQGSLSGQSGASVTYVAPSSVSTATKVTVTATSVANTKATASIAIQVNPPPSITTTSLPAGIAGTCYGQVSTGSGVTCNGATMNLSGGTSPYTWGVVAGGLPPGLTLSSSAGLITGTPTTPGTFNATFRLTDAAGLSSTAALSITIANPPALAVSTTALPTAAINISYNVTLAASGGVAPYIWSLASGSSSLPAGLNLSPSGVISGAPTALGTFSFTVQVTDSEGPAPVSATATLSIIVNPMPFSITTTSLPGGTVGIAYSTTLHSSGGVPPVSWSISGGALPGWASLDASTGIISGSPTAAGTTSFPVEATDSESPTAAIATQTLSISISSTTQNALLNGQYAFSLSGYDGGVVGSFTADGKGNIITGGSEDLKAQPSSSAVSGADVPITSGSYIIGADNRGVLTYTDANSNVFSFDVALSQVGSAPSGASIGGAMIETDKTGDNFTGSLALQSSSGFSSAVLTGGYAFGFSGWDATANPDVVVGSASISSGAVSNGLLDENDSGSVSTAVPFTGALSVDANGRGTITSSVLQANFVFYVISKTQWFAIAYDTSTGAVRTGLVLQQSGGPYSTASIDGTIVLQSQSSTAAPAPQAELGLLTSAGDGTANTSLDIDAGGALSTQTDTATLNVTASDNGRFTFTPQTSTAQVGYMIAPNQAFIAGTGTAASLGAFEPRSTGPFGATSLAGTFYVGSQPLVAPPPNAQPPTVTSGVIGFDGKVALTGTLDASNAGTVTTTELSDSYSVDATGRVTISPGGAILYIASPSKLYILSTGLAGSTNPLIQVAQR